MQDVEDATGHVDDARKSSRGTGGMGSKLLAAGTVKTAGEPVLIANGKRPNVITDLLSGIDTGTLILPAHRKLSSRSRWIGLTARTKGTLLVDDGAAKALRANKSLLAMGIVSADGDFDSGDAVLITDKSGARRPRPLQLLPPRSRPHQGPQIAPNSPSSSKPTPTGMKSSTAMTSSSKDDWPQNAVDFFA